VLKGKAVANAVVEVTSFGFGLEEMVEALDWNPKVSVLFSVAQFHIEPPRLRVIDGSGQ